MNEIGHIFRKDVQRLRWALVGWAFIVVGRLVATTAGVPAAFGDLGLQLVVQNVTLLLSSLDVLMLALMISWLVHDEPLVGLDAFWLTRPIDRTRLMAAKLIFAAVFVVGVPVAGQAATAALIGHSWSAGLRTIPAAAVAEGAWTLTFMVLAVLTPTLMAFLLAIAGSVAGIAVILSAVTTVLFMTRSEEMPDFRPSPITDFTGSIVAAWAMLATGLAVVVFQYRRRRVVPAIAVAISGLAAAFVVSAIWPWRFARANEPDPGAWAHDERRTAAVIDADVRPYVSERPALSERGATKKTVAVPLRFTNVPPDYSVDSFALRARLALPGGIMLQSASFGSVAVPRRELVPDAAGTMGGRPASRVQAALPDVRVPNSNPFEAVQWPVVLTIEAQDFSKYGDVSGRLAADVDADLYRSRVVGTMPLVESAAIQAGFTRFALLRVLRHSDGCSVLVRQSTVPSFGRPSPPRTYELALWNRSRGEAIAGGTEFFPEPGRLLLGNWSVSQDGQSGSVYLVKRYSEAAAEPAMPLDSSWLDRAELAVVETVYAGRLSRSIAVDDFRMRR